MADMAKVIKELESLRDICNAKSDMAIGKGKIVWAGYANATDDAIAMLKEQAAECIEIIDNDGGETHWYVCGGCKSPINPGDRYCHECGKEVKWDADAAD